MRTIFLGRSFEEMAHYSLEGGDSETLREFAHQLQRMRGVVEAESPTTKFEIEDGSVARLIADCLGMADAVGETGEVEIDEAERYW